MNQDTTPLRTAERLWRKLNPSERGPIPTALDPLNPLDFEFAKTVVADYGDLLADESNPWNGCMYQPEGLLPYPKAIVRLCLDYVASSRRTPTFLLDSVMGGLVCLDCFVRAGDELPMDPDKNSLYVVEHDLSPDAPSKDGGA